MAIFMYFFFSSVWAYNGLKADDPYKDGMPLDVQRAMAAELGLSMSKFSVYNSFYSHTTVVNINLEIFNQNPCPEHAARIFHILLKYMKGYEMLRFSVNVATVP